MDRLDAKILKLLSSNARMSLKQISSLVGLTSPAVKSRIERLEKEGIIRGYYADFDRKAAGFMVMAFVNVAVDTGCKKEFDDFIRENPNVLECYGITGNYFALLKVLFRSTMELDNFLHYIQKYGETSTNIVLSEYKDSHGYIALEEREEEAKIQCGAPVDGGRI